MLSHSRFTSREQTLNRRRHLSTRHALTPPLLTDCMLRSKGLSLTSSNSNLNLGLPMRNSLMRSTY
jgi:hypothetical protein